MALSAFKFKPNNNALCLGVAILHIRLVLNSGSGPGWTLIPGGTKNPPGGKCLNSRLYEELQEIRLQISTYASA